MIKHQDFFYDREQEQKDLGAILSSRPNLVHFVYGPINSGKTTLLVRVLESLPSHILPFYINFRGRDLSSTGEFLNCLFKVDKKTPLDGAREYFRELTKDGIDALSRVSGIPIPKRIFDPIFKEKDKGDDAFEYLEEFFGELVEGGRTPVFVLDELQMIKEAANAAGRPLLDKLFNFLVRMTKETHYCHCLAATSDSLFIEEVHGNARLEGRARHFLVDDLDRDRAIKVYDSFGFKAKDLVWSYIGGKFGDMARLNAEIDLGRSESEALEQMLMEQAGRLEGLFDLYPYIPPKVVVQGNEITLQPERVVEALSMAADEGEVATGKLDEAVARYLIERNILFFEPLKRTVRAQSQLILRGIEKALPNLRFRRS